MWRLASIALDMEKSFLTMLLKLGHRIGGLSVLREDDVVWSCFVGKMLGGFQWGGNSAGLHLSLFLLLEIKI